MGTEQRRIREKQQRREDIVTAAERVFFAKGVGSTTMDEIASAAELSKGTLYLYFPSKEELYFAIVERGQAILKRMMTEAVAQEANGLDGVRQLGRAMYEFQRLHPDYFAALFHRELVHQLFSGENPRVKELRRRGEELYALALGAIRRGMTDGSIRPDIDPVMAAHCLQGFVTGLIRTLSLEREPGPNCHAISPEALMEYAFDLVTHSLLNPASHVHPQGDRP